jgi:hypothetical protein
MLVESVWESCKLIWQSGKLNIDKIGTIVIGVLIAVGVRVDLFTFIGISMDVPYLGFILTGILISRGSNYVHDLLGKIEKPLKLIEQSLNAKVNKVDVSTKPTCCKCGCVSGIVCMCQEDCDCVECSKEWNLKGK